MKQLYFKEELPKIKIFDKDAEKVYNESEEFFNPSNNKMVFAFTTNGMYPVGLMIDEEGE